MFRAFSKRRRGLGFESLECRRVMAGNIHAFTVFGHVAFEGDHEANAVDVRGNGNPGELVVTPLQDAATGQQTTVNGSAAPIVITGVTGGLTFRGEEGNDEFSVKDFAFNGDGRMLGDSGADRITIGAYVPYGTQGTGDISFSGELYISEQYESNTGNPGDYYFLGNLTVGTRITVEGWYGNDTLEMYDVTAYGSNDGFATAYIRGQDGSDVVNMAYTTLYGNLKILMDGENTGNDLISIITSVVHGTAYLDVWHGTNTIALNANQFLKTTDVWSEIGNDTMTFTNTFFNKKLNISSIYNNNGNDSITLVNNTISERVYVSTGNGNDTIDMRSNLIVTAGIFSGGGYDGVIVRNNVFYGHADFVGGTEYDILFMSGNLFYSTYGYYEFESVQP
jgi:hypothetical protein